MMRYLNREKETNEFFDSDGFGFTHWGHWLL